MEDSSTKIDVDEINQTVERSDSTRAERTCWVCYGSEVDEPGLEWISPCQCRGATKWVHQLCLQQWVDEKQKGASSVDVNCPQCRFEYQIVYPDTSFLLLIYEHINNLLTSSSPVIIAGVAGSSLYWVLFTHGYVTTALALGKDEFVKFFGTQESSVVLVVLPLMPLAVLGLKLLRLEVYVIKASYWVAPVFYKLINKLSINTGLGNEAVQEYSFVPANVPVVSFLSRSILSTFFLPFISSSVGWFLSFVMKSSSSLRRTVVGGFGYLVVSYALKIWIEHHRGRLENRRH